MSKDPQCRKFQLTINNPIEKGATHESIKNALQKLKSIVYYCLADEVGENNTPHTHIYFCCSSPVRFTTVKNLFDTAHIEAARGYSLDNRDYVSKEGKWADDIKHGTKVEGTFEEWGEMPAERQSGFSTYSELLERIKDGATNMELLEEFPQQFRAIRDIDYIRQTIKADEHRNKWRELAVTYIWGPTGFGKTRSIMEIYGYSNVYRVTDYKHPFDGYSGQETLILDEFDSQIKITDLNNYLDGYPLSLPCRYTNKQACFTNIYIISNIDITHQYKDIQHNAPKQYAALIRRIHKVIEYTGIGEFKSYDTIEYFHDSLDFSDCDGVPEPKNDK